MILGMITIQMVIEYLYVTWLLKRKSLEELENYKNLFLIGGSFLIILAILLSLFLFFKWTGIEDNWMVFTLPFWVLYMTAVNYLATVKCRKRIERDLNKLTNNKGSKKK